MPLIRLPRIYRGQKWQPEHVNAPNEVLEKVQITIGPNSHIAVSSNPSGTTIAGIDGKIIILAKILSGGGGAGASSGPYAWQERFFLENATFIDGYRSGTTTVNPAYESNGNKTVTAAGATPTVELMFEDSAQRWVFRFSKCI